MCIIILHISHFSYFAAKLLQHTAKTCQYGEENTKKNAEKFFLHFFCLSRAALPQKRRSFALDSPSTPYTIHYIPYTSSLLLPTISGTESTTLAASPLSCFGILKIFSLPQCLQEVMDIYQFYIIIRTTSEDIQRYHQLTGWRIFIGERTQIF